MKRPWGEKKLSENEYILPALINLSLWIFCIILFYYITVYYVTLYYPI